MVQSNNTNQAAGHPSAIRIRRVRLTIVRGPNKGSTYVAADNRIRVGKAPDNELVIPHDTVSRHHFEIVRDAWGYLLRDMESTNGTYLDDAEIREAYLRPGAVITAGQTKIKFRTQEDRLEVTPWPDEQMGPLVGRSRDFRLVFGAVATVAPLDVPVLLQGEPGTGRRTLAAIIHDMSEHKNERLSEVNCAVGSPRQVEKQLIGRRNNGDALLTSDKAGTLLLIEPWELSVELQTRMVKALETRREERSTGQRGGRIRIVTVSARELTLEADRGRMDPRLASHLGNVQIHVPALRHRPEDIDALTSHFLSADSLVSAGTAPAVLLHAIRQHRWPGNVPELKQFVESWTQAINAEADPEFLRLLETDTNHLQTFREHKRSWVATFERLFLGRLMRDCQGNVSLAARRAGMDRKYLNNLLKRHGLKE